MGSKHYSLQVIKLLLGHLTYTQSVKNIVSKHDLLLAYLRSSCSLTVQKMDSKHDLPQLKKVFIRSWYTAHIWWETPGILIRSK